MKRAVSALLAAALLAGCGSDGDGDDGDGSGDETQVEKPAPSPDTAVFDSDAVGFTFEYPKDFTADEKTRGNVLGEVAAGRGERFNAIKVRRSADRELPPERYLDEFQHDFARTVGKVEKREETIAGRRTGVLEFEDTLEQGGESVEFTSSSYFFAGGGRTWQVECLADDEHGAEIEAACREALESVDFKPRK